MLRAGDGELADETRSLERIGSVIDVHRLAAVFIAALALGKERRGRRDPRRLPAAGAGRRRLGAVPARARRADVSDFLKCECWSAWRSSRASRWSGSAGCACASAVSGPAVVLLHGHPRTHTTWHRVAPRLADALHRRLPRPAGLRASRGRPTESKRAMAAAIARALMRALGIGDVRRRRPRPRRATSRTGSRVDHGVTRLVVLDGVPIAEALERCDARFAASWWHWFFFAQTEKPAEDVDRRATRWPGTAATRRRWAPRTTPTGCARSRDPAVIRAMVADYRAGVHVDRDHEAADRAAGRRVTCPTLFAWSVHDDMEELYGDPLAIWRAWVDGPAAGRADRLRPPHGRGGARSSSRTC